MSADAVLLVAAVPAELGPLPGEALGVGLVAAATSTARLLAERRAAGRLPARVVLVGTAGAYPGGPAVGAVVTARRVGQGSGTAALGLGYVPMAPEPVDAVALDGLPAVDVLTCIAITTDPALVARHAAAWQVEHMEAFGVAWACARAGVPFSAALGIANEVGPDAHAQWRANRAAVEAAAVEAVARALGTRGGARPPEPG